MKIIAVEFTDQECWDVLTTATESDALLGWIINDRVPCKRNDEGVTELVVTEAEVHPYKKHVINKHTIQLGVIRIMSGEVEAPDTRESICKEDIDSDDADVIIQAGLFGEIRYS